jgi:hypothetical protein
MLIYEGRVTSGCIAGAFNCTRCHIRPRGSNGPAIKRRYIEAFSHHGDPCPFEMPRDGKSGRTIIGRYLHGAGGLVRIDKAPIAEIFGDISNRLTFSSHLLEA